LVTYWRRSDALPLAIASTHRCHKEMTRSVTADAADQTLDIAIRQPVTDPN